MRNNLTNITTLIIDVDGTLTDGRIVITGQGTEIKYFHAKDGWGIKQTLKQGINIVICSGRKSKATEYRCTELGISEIYTGIENKLEWIKDYIRKTGLNKFNLGYIGDDLSDLEAMKLCGWSVAVNDAVDEVKQQADLVTSAKGGWGAVREALDYLLQKRKN